MSNSPFKKLSEIEDKADMKTYKTQTPIGSTTNFNIVSKKTIKLPIEWIKRLNSYTKRLYEADTSKEQGFAMTALLGYLDSLENFYEK